MKTVTVQYSVTVHCKRQCGQVNRPDKTKYITVQSFSSLTANLSTRKGGKLLHITIYFLKKHPITEEVHRVINMIEKTLETAKYVQLFLSMLTNPSIKRKTMT